MGDALLHLSAEAMIEASADGASADKPARASIIAYSGGQMVVKPFGPLVIDLAGADVSGTIPLLAGHDSQNLDGIVGQGQAEKRDGRILIEGSITRATAAGQKVIALTHDNICLQASVGFWPDRRDYVRPGESAKVNGRSFTASEQGLTIIRSGRLREVSLLPVGADSGSSVSISAKGQTMSVGNEPNMQTTTDRLAGVTAAWQAAHWHDPSGQPRLRAERLMLQAAAGLLPVEQFQAQLASELLLDREVELARAQSRAVRSSPRLEAATPPAIEAAFAMSCGLQSPEKHFSPQVLEAADRHRGLGLQEMLLRSAAAAGCDERGLRRGNLREVIRAAFSVNTLTTLLTTTGNKLLLEGFNAIPQSWREVAQVRPVADFKAVTAFRLTAGLEYEELAPSGEIQHGTLGQESYTMQAKTFAKMLVLSRTDIINDDLASFADLRNRLGIGAAIAMNKVFWTAWLSASDGAAFWTGARGNLVTSSALAEAGLNTAVAAFRTLAGPDGNMMTLEPAKIIVPADLEATARKLYTSQEVRDTTANTKNLVSNIYFNRFKPVVVPELNNAAFTGYSPTTWFLVADPAILASAIVCFLGGQEAPTIESAEADFDTLGIQFRGYHDFGASMSEYRARVKATA